MALKFYTSVAKGSKLIPTFLEVAGEKLVGGGGQVPNLNRVKV